MINKHKLKNLRLVVFDLDGTLLNSSGQIGLETKNLVNELSKLGVKFSFATKRLFSAIEQYASELKLDAPIINLDGALVQKYPEKTIHYEAYVKERHVQKAIDLADKFLLKIALCHSEAIYYTEYNSAMPYILESYGAIFKEVDDYADYTKKTLEVIIASDQKDAMKYVNNKLTFPFGLGLDVNFFKSHQREAQYYIEIRKSGSSKGTGLLRLMKHLNVEVKETAVICDWYNDVSLFETGALRVAVANAVPEIKKLADYITQRTNEEDGTAEFLELILRAKKGK